MERIGLVEDGAAIRRVGSTLVVMAWPICGGELCDVGAIEVHNEDIVVEGRGRVLVIPHQDVLAVR